MCKQYAIKQFLFLLHTIGSKIVSAILSDAVKLPGSYDMTVIQSKCIASLLSYLTNFVSLHARENET